MLNQRKLNKLINPVLPTKEDKAFEILDQESTPEYLIQRTIEELRNTKEYPNSPDYVRGIQRSILMLVMTLDKIHSNPRTHGQLKDLIIPPKKVVKND
jgi:hypothetical protein